MESHIDRVGAPPAAVAGAILGFFGVAAGAFGAHALEASLTADQLHTFETAVRYQLIHALALLAHAALFRVEGGSITTWSWRLLFGGTVAFSGSLYLLIWTGFSWLGPITPLGGLALLGGWLLMGIAASRR